MSTTHKHMPGLRRNALASALATVLCTSSLGVAYAQNDEDDEARDENLEELIVTGTRIRRDEFTSPNAMSVISGDDMRDLGITSVADMIAQMPNNVASVTPETMGDSAFFVGSTFANLRGLNTFFGTRTLTLVDSKRFVATNNGGGVDLNFIPSALVGRIETVTGGASASYGSDALAGVVNVILDRNLEGTRIELGYKETSEGDGDEFNFSLASGFSVLDGRGQVTFGIDHTDQKGIDDCTTRDFCRASRGIIQNGAATAPFFQPPPPPYSVRNSNVTEIGQPQYIISEGLRYAVVPQGVLWSTGSVNTQYMFNDAGNDVIQLYQDLTPEQIEVILNEGVTGDTPYGTGNLTYAGIPMLPNMVRDNFYGRFAYELEGGIELTAEVSYGDTDSRTEQDSTRQSLGPFIDLYEDNAFVQLGSPALQAAIAERVSRVTPGTFNGCFNAPYLGGSFQNPFGTPADGYDCIRVTKDWSGQLDRVNTTNTSVQRVVLGANGELTDNWSFDTYFQYGFTDRKQNITDWPSSNRAQMALDAVIDSNTGEPVCRVLESGAMGEANRQKWLTYFEDALQERAHEAPLYLESLSAGCAPLNPFGFAMSPEARAYAFPNIVEGSEITQRVLSTTFSGQVWDGIGAGALQMAAGIDAREETTRNYTGDDPITARDFFLNYGDAWAGRSTTNELFAEFELPLLRDKPAADYLMINLADRRSQNKTERLSGDPLSVTRYQRSWKASMVWQPLEIMRIRLTRSTDTRAPAPRELYQSNTAAAVAGGAAEIQNPFRDNLPEPGDERYDEYQSVVGGNSRLEQETSISETIGIVFTPQGALRGLQASVDYYETTVKGGIENVSVNQTLSRCYFEITNNIPDPEYCANIEFGPEDPRFPGNPYSNVVRVASSQENVAPYWNRGVDYSVSYFRQLSGGGTFSVRMLATRFLEQSVDLGGYFPRMNVAGQTGSNGLGSIFGGFGINFSPTPDVSGNLFFTYAKNAFSITTQVRYVGSGRLNNQDGWIGPGEFGQYVDPATGEVVGPFEYSWDRDRTVSDPDLPSWATMNLNFSYDFARSPFAPRAFDGLSAFVNIENVGDRVPDFFSGNGPGGVNTTFFSGLGRQIRLGMRMEF
ncbi:MAG TPA: TonB-dependent receptor plug domain-containing protein [Gammaproteobacteria bacterium]